MKDFFLKLKRQIGYAFFPARCPFCDCVIHSGETVCRTCRETVRPLERGIRLRDDKTGGLIFLYQYTGQPKTAVSRFKFQGRKDLARPLSRLLWEQIEKCGLDFDLIVPVPMSSQKRRRRGYNQAQLLAEGLSELTGVPWKNCLLQRDTEFFQHQLSAKERRYWAERTYSAADPNSCFGRKILLVDDVYTTGSTARACENCLRNAGAVCVITAVLCKTERKN